MTALPKRQPGPASAVATVPSVDPWVGRPTLLAVDGNGLVHRAFHGYARDATTDAEAVAAAMRGVLALLCGLCDRVPAQWIAVAFDDPERCARTELFAGYKAGRPPKAPALGQLLVDMPVLLAELGVSVEVAPGWEADDVLASAAEAACASGRHAVLATADRDAFICVADHCTVLRLRDGLRTADAITPATFRSEFGIGPGQYLDFSALRGDTSDALGGMLGIGPSKAAALLVELGSLEAAAADPIGTRSVLGPTLGQALLDDMASEDSVVRRNLDLMAPRRDLPLDVDSWTRSQTPEAITAALTARGLAPMAARVAVALSC